MAAASLALVDSIVISILSRLEHHRSIKPSSLLQLYLLTTLLFDAVRSRTLWLAHANPAISGAFTAAIVVKSAMLLLESKGKKEWLIFEMDRSQSPEATSSLFNRSVFWWLNKLFDQGYKTVLTVDDLFTMDADLTSEEMRDRFQNNW